MERGEVRWYTFAPPDKTRPVLILSRDLAVRKLSEVVVARVTTNVRRLPSEVLFTPADGAPRVCCANLDRLFTIPKAKIGEVVMRLSVHQMGEVRSALLFALGFED